MNLIAATLCSSQYLAEAVTASQSLLEKANNKVNIFIMCIDMTELALCRVKDEYHDFCFISPKDASIVIENYPKFYNDLELCYALKPDLLDHISSNYEADFYIYFDSDTFFVNSLFDAVASHFEYGSIYLFPHAGNKNIKLELAAIRTGLFNAGFIILSGPNILEFLSWWKSRTLKHSLLEPDQGYFVDQHWLSIAVLHFESIRIYRRPLIFNIGYWNLENSEIDNIVCYHLSGWISSHKAKEKSSKISKFSNTRLGDHLTKLADYDDRLNEQRRKLRHIEGTICNSWCNKEIVLNRKGDPCLRRLKECKPGSRNNPIYVRQPPAKSLRPLATFYFSMLQKMYLVKIHYHLFRLLAYFSRTSSWLYRE